jgi:hypothetical protein
MALEVLILFNLDFLKMRKLILFKKDFFFNFLGMIALLEKCGKQ